MCIYRSYLADVKLATELLDGLSLDIPDSTEGRGDTPAMQREESQAKDWAQRAGSGLNKTQCVDTATSSDKGDISTGSDVFVRSYWKTRILLA